jgi:hypothetical protein
MEKYSKWIPSSTRAKICRGEQHRDQSCLPPEQGRDYTSRKSLSPPIIPRPSRSIVRPPQLFPIATTTLLRESGKAQHVPDRRTRTGEIPNRSFGGVERVEERMRRRSDRRGRGVEGGEGERDEVRPDSVEEQVVAHAEHNVHHVGPNKHDRAGVREQSKGCM